MKSQLLGLVLVSTSLASVAQLVPKTFPEGAAVLTPETFNSKVAGRSFSGVRSDGVDMRMDINKDGTLIWYARGASDQGKWRLEGDKFCQDLPRFGSTCNEFRIGENAVYYKRLSTGEVLTLKLR